MDCMASEMEQAKELASLVVILTMAGPLLWLATSFDTSSPDQYMRVATGVIVELAVPAFRLIILFFVAIVIVNVVSKIQK